MGLEVRSGVGSIGQARSGSIGQVRGLGLEVTIHCMREHLEYIESDFDLIIKFCYVDIFHAFSVGGDRGNGQRSMVTLTTPPWMDVTAWQTASPATLSPTGACTPSAMVT